VIGNVWRWIGFGLCAACASEPSAWEPNDRAAEDPVVRDVATGSSPDLTDTLRADTLRVAGARAHLAEVPPNADPERAIVLDEPLGDLPVGFRLLEAHRIGGADGMDEGLLVLQTNHELWWRDARGARRLERDVEAPLSVRGRQVAFARGHMPDFEIVLLTIGASTGEPAGTDFVLPLTDPLGQRGQPLTDGYAPAWNPALGPAGDVVFVSGRSGEPELYRVRPGEAPVKLVLDGPFPSALEAPIHDGVSLSFRDEQGAPHVQRIRYADDAPRVDPHGPDTTGPNDPLEGGAR
jgi:hypothetical protein